MEKLEGLEVVETFSNSKGTGLLFDDGTILYLPSDDSWSLINGPGWTDTWNELARDN